MSALRPLALLSSGRVRSVVSSAGRIPPWAFAGAALAGILPIAVLGQIHRHDQGSHWYLDNEDTLPAAFSGALLLAAAVLAVLVASLVSRGRFRSFWLGMGAVFAFMALDEVWTIHERLEGGTGADWQLFYVPVVVGAGVLLLLALRDLSPPAKRQPSSWREQWRGWLRRCSRTYNGRATSWSTKGWSCPRKCSSWWEPCSSGLPRS